MSISIRQMSVNDVLAASKLASTCYSFLAEQEGFSDFQLKQLLDMRCSTRYVRQSACQFDRRVLELDGRIVGLVAIEENDLGELWVLPEHHREGIGTLLFQEGERLIAGRGHRTLTVRTTGYAVPFYKAMGAHVVGRKPCASGPLKGWELTYLEKPLSATLVV